MPETPDPSAPGPQTTPPGATPPSDAPPSGAPSGADHRWISAFLDAQAAEAGAARNTLLAYGRDLKDAQDWIGKRGQYPF